MEQEHPRANQDQPGVIQPRIRAIKPRIQRRIGSPLYGWAVLVEHSRTPIAEITTVDPMLSESAVLEKPPSLPGVISSRALPSAAIRTSQLLAPLRAESMPFILLKASSIGFNSEERVGRQVQSSLHPPAARPVLSEPFSLVSREVVHDHNPQPALCRLGASTSSTGRPRRWQRWLLPPPQKRGSQILATFTWQARWCFSYRAVARHRGLRPLSTSRPKHAAPTARWSCPSRLRRRTAVGPPSPRPHYSPGNSSRFIPFHHPYALGFFD